MTRSAAFDLDLTYLRLRPDASVEKFDLDDNFWPRLIAGQLGSFHNEYLVSSYSFDSDWPTWEMHPNGDEVVCLLSGAATFVLEKEGGNETVELNECGSFVIVPKGVWHTARPHGRARMLFISAGEGTQHREATK